VAIAPANLRVAKRINAGRFLHRCTEIAEKAGITVFQINFNDYSGAAEALSATENQDFVSAVEKPAGRTLLIFENADCLAPLDCKITYSLRSILTTNLDGNTVSLFHAQTLGCVVGF
jgi:hypothetical protein